MMLGECPVPTEAFSALARNALKRLGIKGVKTIDFEHYTYDSTKDFLTFTCIVDGSPFTLELPNALAVLLKEKEERGI